LFKHIDIFLCLKDCPYREAVYRKTNNSYVTLDKYLKFLIKIDLVSKTKESRFVYYIFTEKGNKVYFALLKLLEVL
jgi:predicted transcriptional regulator